MNVTSNTPATAKRNINVSKNQVTKGDLTKSLILDAALHIVGKDGFEGLSIGALAEKMGMSKSGVYAHFESKEDIQLQVIKEYHQRFRALVFAPSLKLPRGLPRLKQMLESWTELTISEVSTGCIYISGAFELDDQTGALRDQLVQTVTTWRKTLIKAIEMAIEQGHIRADANPREMLFCFYSVILGIQHDSRFLKNTQSSEYAKRLIKKVIDDNKPKNQRK
jgi:AcrR family transcriptional regulator